jgi:hypothetical protein
VKKFMVGYEMLAEPQRDINTLDFDATPQKKASTVESAEVDQR